MAENLDEAKLRSNIAEIIKNGDLATLTSKKIRQILEKKFDVNLMQRKKQIDDIVMQLVDEQSDSSDNDGSRESTSRSDTKTSNKASSDQETPLVKSERVSVIASNKAKNKRKAKEESESDEPESDDNDSDEDVPKPKRKTSPMKRPAAKEKTKKATKPKEEGGKKRTGFSMPMLLSPELAALMGETHMARSEVVKKMWQIIKERDLMDPTNKRYTICDEELEKIIGQKRFMTFAMMKYLKKHVKDPALM